MRVYRSAAKYPTDKGAAKETEHKCHTPAITKSVKEEEKGNIAARNVRPYDIDAQCNETYLISMFLTGTHWNTRKSTQSHYYHKLTSIMSSNVSSAFHPDTSARTLASSVLKSLLT